MSDSSLADASGDEVPQLQPLNGPGGRFAGVGLFVLAGKPMFHDNLCGVERYSLTGKDPIPPGKHVVTIDFNYDGGVRAGGEATLTVDGNKVAGKKLPRTIAFRMSLDETLGIGEDTDTPISEDDEVPFNSPLKNVCHGCVSRADV